METQGECITSKVRPGLANAPLGVGRDLRSRTAALSNPLCYPIGASEVRAYGEPPSTSRPTSRRFPPARALVFPFSSLMPSHQRSGVRQHRPRYGLGRQGVGGGAAGLGPPKAISEAGAYAVCVRAADPGHAPAPHSSK